MQCIHTSHDFHKFPSYVERYCSLVKTLKIFKNNIALSWYGEVRFTPLNKGYLIHQHIVILPYLLVRVCSFISTTTAYCVSSPEQVHRKPRWRLKYFAHAGRTVRFKTVSQRLLLTPFDRCFHTKDRRSPKGMLGYGF